MRRPSLHRRIHATTGLGLLLSAGCGAPSATFEFVHGPEPGAATFVAVTSNPVVIRAIRAELAKPLAERTQHINGPIERDAAGRNAPWSWRFTSHKWVLTDFSMEPCDGTPSEVEENLDRWLEEVGRYCPWASRVSREL